MEFSAYLNKMILVRNWFLFTHNAAHSRKKRIRSRKLLCIQYFFCALILHLSKQIPWMLSDFADTKSSSSWWYKMFKLIFVHCRLIEGWMNKTNSLKSSSQTVIQSGKDIGINWIINIKIIIWNSYYVCQYFEL